LSGLVDVADISDLRKDFIEDIIQGMDKVGRMLFLYYWHQDEFEDRYGKQDIKRLEEVLKEVFATTGDLVLFIKEKTTNAPDSVDNMLGRLSEDVATADVDEV